MKYLTTALVFTMLSASCWAATPTTIMTAVLSGKVKISEVSVGFSESSFDYDNQNQGGLRPENKSMCYIGEAAKVCDQIRAFEGRTNLQYTRGAHDNITVQKCDVTDQNTVQTTYLLTDDYGGDMSISREIKNCE